jgi:two-component system, NtrC family, sensor kinase
MGLRLRLTISLLAPLLLVIGVHGLIRIQQERAALLDAHRDSLARTADVIVAALEHVMQRHAVEIQALLSQLARSQHQIARIRLFDRNGTPSIVSNLLPVDDSGAAPRVLAVLERGAPDSFHEEGERYVALFHITPVRGPDGQPVAALEVVELALEIETQVQRAVWDVWVRLGLVALAVALAMGVILQRQVFDRLSELARGIVSLAEGKAATRVPVERRDELGRVAEAFNDMATQLAAARVKLETETERALDLQQHLRHAERLAIAGKLASGLAHEIGTPLNIISGRAEMLVDTLPADDPRRGELSGIVEQIDRISAIIRSLLDTARQTKPEPQPVAVADVVLRLWPLMEHAARRRGIVIRSAVDRNVPKVLADANELQQVLINLLMNAFEAMPPGGRATVTAAREDRGERAGVTIGVQDTGSGIAPEALAHIFEPFYSTKPAGQGTGLGLPISRDIVREHGGDLVVSKTGGDGTTVTVWLPAAEEESA